MVQPLRIVDSESLHAIYRTAKSPEPALIMPVDFCQSRELPRKALCEWIDEVTLTVAHSPHQMRITGPIARGGRKTNNLHLSKSQQSMIMENNRYLS